MRRFCLRRILMSAVVFQQVSVSTTIVLTAQYQPGLGKWQFDVTLQLNGGGRMPDAIKEGFKKLKYEAQEVKPEEKKDGD